MRFTQRTAFRAALWRVALLVICVSISHGIDSIFVPPTVMENTANHKQSGRLHRLTRLVYVDSIKPQRRYVKPTSLPGPAYDMVVFGIMVLFGIASLLV